MMARWQRYELIAVDEVGYVPLADVGAGISVPGDLRAGGESGAHRGSTNLPFSEWTTVFPNPRLCQKALLDRIADRAHVIEQGTESFRFTQNHGKEKRKQRETPLTAARLSWKLCRKVSFLRHAQIYRSDVVLKARSEAVSRFAPAHRFDEFADGYSLAVCSPAWPASASPAGIHVHAGGSSLSTGSFGKISKLDSRTRTRQNINSVVGQNRVSKWARPQYQTHGAS